MDDLASAPAQRTSDNGGRTPGDNFTALRKAVKKVQPAPAKNHHPGNQRSDPEPDVVDHQLNVLA